MIGYLRGEILEHSEGRMLVLAGTRETSGVGYAVSVPNGPEYLSYLPGKTIELYVHTHVREDALDLYGFASRLEKELFLTLLSVNGIGPKGAIGMLSKVSSTDLIEAILAGDKESLTQVPGIGKKTAERVVLELADSLRKKVDAGLFGDFRQGSGSAAAKGAPSKAGAGSRQGGKAGGVYEDAKSALVGLGYREQDVVALLNRIVAEAETPPKQPEDLVKAALKQL